MQRRRRHVSRFSRWDAGHPETIGPWRAGAWDRPLSATWGRDLTVDPFRKHCLLHGLDEIGLTLEKEKSIAGFEQREAEERPWL
jgi:hypothetical protein